MIVHASGVLAAPANTATKPSAASKRDRYSEHAGQRSTERSADDEQRRDLAALEERTQGHRGEQPT